VVNAIIFVMHSMGNFLGVGLLSNLIGGNLAYEHKGEKVAPQPSKTFKKMYYERSSSIDFKVKLPVIGVMQSRR
jgi:hypothetical protein